MVISTWKYLNGVKRLELNLPHTNIHMMMTQIGGKVSASLCGTSIARGKMH